MSLLLLDESHTGLFPPERGRLSIQGTHFYTDTGALWQWRGYSYFLGPYHVMRGEQSKVRADCRWLRAHGVNLVRSFGPLNWDELIGYQWQDFNPDRLREYFGILGDEGLRGEHSVICYPYETAEQRRILQQSTDEADKFEHMFIEGSNEPFRPIDGKIKCNPVELYQGVNKRNVLHAYGSYPLDGEKYSTHPMLHYGTTHLRRDSAWARGARELEALQRSTGKPWISDEPKKAIEDGFVYAGGTRSTQEYVHHVAVSELWAAGTTVHTEQGKWGDVPTSDTPIQCAIVEAVRDACYKKIDATWQIGEYNHSGNHDSPVDDVNYPNGDPIWTYTSLHAGKALSVRVAFSEPKAINGWTIRDKWGPGNSIVRLEK